MKRESPSPPLRSRTPTRPTGGWENSEIQGVFAIIQQFFIWKVFICQASVVDSGIEPEDCKESKHCDQTETIMRVKDPLAAVWPFCGIVVEVELSHYHVSVSLDFFSSPVLPTIVDRSFPGYSSLCNNIFLRKEEDRFRKGGLWRRVRILKHGDNIWKWTHLLKDESLCCYKLKKVVQKCCIWKKYTKGETFAGQMVTTSAQAGNENRPLQKMRSYHSSHKFVSY